MSEMTAAEYKAQVDARYSNVKERTEEELRRRGELRSEPPRHDHWLLVGPNGEVDGVRHRSFTKSATEAFEGFFPKKRERLAAAAEGWHIEEDDENGSRWAASIEKHAEESK